MALLFLVSLSVLPFSIPYFSSNITIVIFFSEKGIEDFAIEENDCDVYQEQTALTLAIQAVLPDLMVQGGLDVEADYINRSLGNLANSSEII